jgi:pyocin large subunit-like protein
MKSRTPLARVMRTALTAVLAFILVVLSVLAPSSAFAAKKAFPNGGRRSGENTPTTSIARRPAPTKLAPRSSDILAPSTRTDPRLRRIGFRSKQKFDQHFQKHGREFGNITQAQYLAMAQDIRDAPLSKRVIETVQSNGAFSRFDRQTGGFIAFDRDLTLRTFFRPDDGENYFWRAAKR